MSATEFLEHHRESTFFHEYYEEAKSYGAAREALRKRDNASLKQKTISKLRSIFRKFKKRPSLKYITEVGKTMKADNPSY